MTDVKTFVRQHGWLTAVLVLTTFAVACGGGGESEMEGDGMEDMEMNEPAAAPEPTAQPRVFFVAPTDGEDISVDIPVAFEFGIENFQISPVPETVDQVRPGMGHYHLGVDTTCLPAGQIIEQGNPSWIHFGDGSNTIEMSLEAGEHTFAVQVADDEHRTLDGLCEEITIRLEEGI